jgi:hypothetical protein
MREVQYPQISRAEKKTRPFTLTIYGPEVCTPSRLRHLDTGTETDVCYRPADADNEDEFGSDSSAITTYLQMKTMHVHDLVKLISGE